MTADGGSARWVFAWAWRRLPAALARVRSGRARSPLLAEVLVAVSAATSPIEVRDALRTALRDPHLQIWRATPSAADYATIDRQPVDPARHKTGRVDVAVPTTDAGRFILTTSDHRVDSGTLMAVARAAGAALDNCHLLERLSEQAAELRAARSRIVKSVEAERRRLERDIHDGAQQRLLALGLTLAVAEQQAPAETSALLVRARTQLQSAIDELRQLTLGLGPPALLAGGLAGAVAELARHSPVPTLVEIPPTRFDPAVEASAYFVIAEALTNVAKHAHAGQAAVRVREEGDTLVVEVSDDGVGGTTVDRSAVDRTGLPGLVERMQAVGGMLEVGPGDRAGTRIVARLPCA